ncbi:MAG: hypothetical protein KJ718_01035 [Nanoarchaeota archaeon]|nr:hypothetical protein [Nanoarchaeota archaeon]MBU1051119.1 hypothetical protein [Nanoarchaeota archaeon]MBU1988409.1 hypothetical protein [Nanoarchaeota archaeon]
MPLPTIRSVFAAFLREVSSRPELAREVVLEGFMNGRYYKKDDAYTEGFTYGGKVDGNIGTIIYRGKHKRKHAFYFIPTPRLQELDSEHLLDIATELIDSNRITGQLEVISDHVALKPPLTKEEKLKVPKKKRTCFNTFTRTDLGKRAKTGSVTFK